MSYMSYMSPMRYTLDSLAGPSKRRVSSQVKEPDANDRPVELSETESNGITSSGDNVLADRDMQDLARRQAQSVSGTDNQLRTDSAHSSTTDSVSSRSWVRLSYPLFSYTSVIHTAQLTTGIEVSEVPLADSEDTSVSPTVQLPSVVESKPANSSASKANDSQIYHYPRFYNWQFQAFRDMNVKSLDEAADAFAAVTRPSRVPSPTYVADQDENSS